MRKLRLNFETLRVESFVTETGSAQRGTVEGQSLLFPSHYSICPVICGGAQDSDDCPVSYGYAGECPQTPNTACEM